VIPTGTGRLASGNGGDLTNRRLIALISLSIGLGLATLGVVLSGSDSPGRWAFAVPATLTTMILLGAGVYAWSHGVRSRFGAAAFVTGVCWFLASLSNSDAALLYSIGRIFGWFFELALIYTLVSYPSGKLEGRAERILVGVAVAVVVVLYLPTIPLIERYPLPTIFTNCAAGCPVNAFFAGSEPGFIGGIVKPLREIITMLVFGSAAVLLLFRLRAASRTLRRALVPVLGAALLGFGAAAFYVILRRTGVDPDLHQAVRLVVLLTVPLTVLGFLAGLLRWRVYSADALVQLTTGLIDPLGPAGIQDLLARSLAEPAVELRYAPPGKDWCDVAGTAALPPAPRAGSGFAEADSGLRVAVICPPAFGDYPDFLNAVASCVTAGLERQRLDLALTDSLAEMTESRKRLAGASYEARRTIERNLHDGAQQRLVALRVRLELARESAERPTGDTPGDLLADLGTEVDEIISEVRSLAHGIYPPLLVSGGLGEALRAAGRRSPLPVTVETDGVARHPMETESAVYFCCLEALQNAAKHAVGATKLAITLRDGPELRFEVTDNGCGLSAEAATRGTGITGMRDRLAAVGGDLAVGSMPGGGTRIRGWIARPGAETTQRRRHHPD